MWQLAAAFELIGVLITAILCIRYFKKPRIIRDKIELVDIKFQQAMKKIGGNLIPGGMITLKPEGLEFDTKYGIGLMFDNIYFYDVKIVLSQYDNNDKVWIRATSSEKLNIGKYAEDMQEIINAIEEDYLRYYTKNLDLT